LARKIVFWPISRQQFQCFWNWFGKSTCPGLYSSLDVNFHLNIHAAIILPENITSFHLVAPAEWVSEDGVLIDEAL